MTRRRSPRPSSERPGNDLRGTIKRLGRKDLRTTAAFALGVGVLLPAGVAFAVLGGGPSGGEGQVQAPAAPVATATPARLPDRRNCAEMRDTAYRSPGELEGFRADCIPPAPP